MMRAFDAGSRAGGCRSRFTAHAVAMLNLLRQPFLPVLREANCLCGSRSGWYALCLFGRGRVSAATGSRCVRSRRKKLSRFRRLPRRGYGPDSKTILVTVVHTRTI